MTPKRIRLDVGGKIFSVTLDMMNKVEQWLPCVFPARGAADSAASIPSHSLASSSLAAGATSRQKMAPSSSTAAPPTSRWPMSVSARGARLLTAAVQLVVDFLRDGFVDVELGDSDVRALIREADFYQLRDLVKLFNRKQRDTWCESSGKWVVAVTTLQDHSGHAQRHGVARRPDADQEVGQRVGLLQPR